MFQDLSFLPSSITCQHTRNTQHLMLEIRVSLVLSEEVERVEWHSCIKFATTGTP